MVSNIFYFHPYLGKIPILTNMFQLGWNHQLDCFSPEKPCFGLWWINPQVFLVPSVRGGYRASLCRSASKKSWRILGWSLATWLLQSTGFNFGALKNEWEKGWPFKGKTRGKNTQQATQKPMSFLGGMGGFKIVRCWSGLLWVTVWFWL